MKIVEYQKNLFLKLMCEYTGLLTKDGTSMTTLRLKFQRTNNGNKKNKSPLKSHPLMATRLNFLKKQDSNRM